MALVFRLHHRGFSLILRAQRADAGIAYGFLLVQGEHTLHASEAVHATVAGADRAGRRFVDDALSAYAWAAERLDVEAYSSSK